MEQIREITDGKFELKGSNDTIKHLLIDSRRVVLPSETLFVAIRGERNDGHDYINELQAKGLKNFLVSDLSNLNFDRKDVNVIYVKDSLYALQRIAEHHRNQFKIPVIAITGSNGKTIVKEWLWQLLSFDQRVLKSPKSYNSQIGVPLSLWQLKEDHELAIFEAGISQKDEMQNLEQMIHPNIGIITNIREAHLGNFKGKNELAGEKLKLFSNADELIYCSDYEVINQEINSNPNYKNLKKTTWSYTGSGDLQIESIEKNRNSTIIKARFNNETTQINIPFSDDASIENAMHCWLTMIVLGYTEKDINKRIGSLTAVAMRLEVRQGLKGNIVVNDSYNSDLASLHIALDFLNQQKSINDTIVILSDVVQSGRNMHDLNVSIAELMKNKGIDQFIGIGPQMIKYKAVYSEGSLFYNSTGEFLQNLHQMNWQNNSILLKGARMFKFEKIAERLQKKAHETVLEVNLSSLISNFNYFKAQLRKKTKIMVMVKASSYGVGSFEIANALQYNQADYLGVAYADEGIALKQEGINLPIMVMNPETSAFDAMIRHDLEPEIYNLRTLHLFLHQLKENQYFLERNEPYPLHLKIDTGMHRLGFEREDIGEMIRVLLENSSVVRIKSVFSHLAAADNPKKNEFSQQQIRQFEEVCDLLKKELNQDFDRHILNSSGILRFPEAQYEMVRLGIGVYGITENEKHAKNLIPVSRLKTIISQIRTVKSGETVGYGNQSQVKKDTKVATIPIGYADGLNRKLGNGNCSFRVKNTKVPTIGNICMDMCMIDISDVEVEEGDEVLIFENQKDLIQMASKLETIPYEILTSVSSRVKRIFYED